MSRLPPAPSLGELSGTGLNRTSAGNSPAHRPPLGPRVASDSSSGSSHSSHSSHIEREREAHLGEALDQIPSVAKPVAASIAVLLYLFVAQACGLWLFTGGFLLTRTTLEDVTNCSAPPVSSWSPPQPSFTIAEARIKDNMRQWEEVLLSQSECTLPAKYKQTVLWIIDALRFDFIADAQATGNTTWQPNPHYHDVFQTPAKIHGDAGDSFSFLSHFLADAPTTTLQRLKGLTTGSLPTFIDAGSNFGGSAITEDNWLAQMRKVALKDGKASMGFVGDDTWVSVFPTVFDKAWTWPYDSFNVEDLDSVDRGVEKILNNFLRPGQDNNLDDWRLLVAHMLGVDHVGHRLGASHPRMAAKLSEMDSFMQQILDKLPEDALLVLMGDHGMDERGDHGGDGELQVGSGLWMYSKKKDRRLDAAIIGDIVANSSTLVPSHLSFSPLPSPPFHSEGHRSVPQIDFVPTVSLLLGLPIPFNNLGSIIPEAFGSLDMLLRALRINSIQIHGYLEKYSIASTDLKPFLADIDAAWQSALQKDAQFALIHHGSKKSSREQALKEACSAYMTFNRLALIRAKAVWAKFEMSKIIVGLVLLVTSLLTCVTVKSLIAPSTDMNNVFLHVYQKSKVGVLSGSIIMTVLKLASYYGPTTLFAPIFRFSIMESTSLGAILGGQVSLIASSQNSSSLSISASLAAVLSIAVALLHALAFSSNSFTVHEDRVVLALVIAILGYRGVQGYLNAPTTRLKIRIPAFALLAMLSLRLAATVRVCREEHGRECLSTFYAAGDAGTSSIWSIAVAYLLALLLPTMISRALNMSRSFAGVAPLFVNWMVRPALLFGAGFWLVDWTLSAESVSLQEGDPAYKALQFVKLAVARVDLALIVIIGFAFWIFSPLCLELTKEDVAETKATSTTPASPPGQQRIIVLGFANSFGSSYLLLFTLVFALLFLLAQPSGQITLTLISIALFCAAEIGDGERDTALLRRQQNKPGKIVNSLPTSSLPLSFLEIATVALIGFVAFFSTGHQATFDSIQWRTAFVGFEKVNYPFSPLLVILNSFAPLALLPSIFVAFLVLYNLAPRPRAAPNSSEKTERMPVVKHILQASLSLLLYHLIITISTAIFAAHFKRHLMLFKIWTPRFMLGAVSLQITFLGLCLGLLAAGNVMSKVSVTFGSHF